MVKVQNYVAKTVQEQEVRKFMTSVDSDVNPHWSKFNPTEKTTRMWTLKVNRFHQGMAEEIQRKTGLSLASIIKSALAERARELKLFE